MGEELKMFRCRLRTGGRTVDVECLAPAARDAAWAVAQEALMDDGAPWVQVVVSQWFAALGCYVEPANATMIARGDPQPAGAARVVTRSRDSGTSGHESD